MKTSRWFTFISCKWPAQYPEQRRPQWCQRVSGPMSWWYIIRRRSQCRRRSSLWRFLSKKNGTCSGSSLVALCRRSFFFTKAFRNGSWIFRPNFCSYVTWKHCFRMSALFAFSWKCWPMQTKNKSEAETHLQVKARSIAFVTTVQKFRWIGYS